MKAMKYTGAAVLSFLFLSSGKFSNTAITLQNPVAATGSSTVNIHSNTITGCRIGIHARNIPGISIGSYLNGSTPVTTKNIITFNQPDYNDYHHGMWLEHCDNANMQENEITKQPMAYHQEIIQWKALRLTNLRAHSSIKITLPI